MKYNYHSIYTILNDEFCTVEDIPSPVGKWPIFMSTLCNLQTSKFQTCSRKDGIESKRDVHMCMIGRLV